MAPHSSTLVWTIPWTEERGGLQSMGSLRVHHDWRLHFHFPLSCIGEGNGNPLQCSCLENPRDGEPGGPPSTGSHRVGHDWSDLAAAAACCLFTYLWRKIWVQIFKNSSEGFFSFCVLQGLSPQALGMAYPPLIVSLSPPGGTFLWDPGISWARWLGLT